MFFWSQCYDVCEFIRTTKAFRQYMMSLDISTENSVLCPVDETFINDVVVHTFDQRLYYDIGYLVNL